MSVWFVLHHAYCGVFLTLNALSDVFLILDAISDIFLHVATAIPIPV